MIRLANKFSAQKNCPLCILLNLLFIISCQVKIKSKTAWTFSNFKNWKCEKTEVKILHFKILHTRLVNYLSIETKTNIFSRVVVKLCPFEITTPAHHKFAPSPG